MIEIDLTHRCCRCAWNNPVEWCDGRGRPGIRLKPSEEEVDGSIDYCWDGKLMKLMVLGVEASQDAAVGA